MSDLMSPVSPLSNALLHKLIQNLVVFAWCVQYVPLSQSGEQPRKRKSSTGRLRVTCFWQHDLRAMWNFGAAASVSQQLSTMMLGLFKTVERRGHRVPVLTGYGNGVSIERIRFQVDRQALTVEYSIHPEDEDAAPQSSSENKPGLDELHAVREHRRLMRSIECTLPSTEGWDVQVSTKASSEKVETLPWTAQAIRAGSSSELVPPSPGKARSPNIFRVTHAPLPDDHSILKVKVILELSGPSNGLRLNGIPQSIQTIEERDPSSYVVAQKMLQDASSSGDISFRTASSSNTAESVADSEVSAASTRTPGRPQSDKMAADRSAAMEKSIISRVRRNYIYFSSLLQEPEAKWKQSGWSLSISKTESINANFLFIQPLNSVGYLSLSWTRSIRL